MEWGHGRDVERGQGRDVEWEQGRDVEWEHGRDVEWGTQTVLFPQPLEDSGGRILKRGVS